MKLWYQKPAAEWTEALPLGNGQMGAMCYGGAEGKFELSENTCWSGKPEKYPLSEHAGEQMTEARKMLLCGEYEKAEDLLKNCLGIKKNYGTKLPMGRLKLAVEGNPTAVYRELDLETGIALDRLEFAEGKVERESFLSAVDKVLSVSMTAEGKVPAFCLWLEGYNQPALTRWKEDKKELRVTGRALDLLHSDGLSGVSYRMALRYDTDGTVSWNRRGLVIENATRLHVFVTAATDMFEKDTEQLCRLRLDISSAKKLPMVRKQHLAEHTAGMNRCVLQMPDTHPELPTDERIRAFAEDSSDTGLIALFFQYGRYLIFNTSRPDSALPAALQGVWSDDRACRMEWTDDMHLDINTQMNYYPAENTGLGDCVLPLLRWIKDILVPNGRIMAEKLYHARGWCAHTVSNAFGWAAPGWGIEWGLSPSCGGWIATHIWEHYRYTGDQAFLAEYYDVLYGSAEFFADILEKDPKTGKLVTVPSYSPENPYRYQGKNLHICTGAAFDMTVVRTIFDIVQKAADILGKRDAFVDSLARLTEELAPYTIGKHGQLMEWHEDFEEASPDHRHTSHLLAMHPFNQIDPASSPELKAAIETTLKRRLGENARDIVYANWAGALLITHYARLLDREKAGEFVRPMIAFLSRKNMMITHQGETTSITGGIYELDGNTGFTAAIAEMLLQSHTDKIHLLPAVPDSWKTGSVTGMRSRGGYEISIRWDEKFVFGSIFAPKDGEVRLLCYGKEQVLNLGRNELTTFVFPKE